MHHSCTYRTLCYGATVTLLEYILMEICSIMFKGGVIRLTNGALKHMSKANGGDGGVILHTSSVGGWKQYISLICESTEYFKRKQHLV